MLLIILILIFLLGLILLGAAIRWRRLASAEHRVLLTGGGTGGHVNPALAIAEGIRAREPDTRFLYVGVRGKAETVIVKRAGYPLYFVSSEGFPGLRPSLRTLRFLCRLSLGVVQSMGILLWFAPRWVIATGGYVSAPIITATLLLKLLRVAPARIFLHEQNSIPGQLNAFLGRWVDRVLLTFPQTLSFFPNNGVVVGYPIRGAIARNPREEAARRLSFKVPSNRKVVFAFGGSQGARTINRAMVGALKYLLSHREKLFIIHGMGLNRSAAYDAVDDTQSQLEKALSDVEMSLLDGFYYRQDYFHNIEDVYSVSDLIVCRSGAGSLNEISGLGIPAILIPKANLPGDHQVMNARAMKHCGAAEILFEDTVVEDGTVLERLDGKLLAERVLRLLGDPVHMKEMSTNSSCFLMRHAVERILAELYRDGSLANETCPAMPFRPLLSNHALLGRLSAAYERSRGTYSPLAVIGDEDDLYYYRHRAAGLLSHDAWQERNLGVKLIGLTRYEEEVPTLLHMLGDRTPERWIKRLLSGDFREVGFVRRNILQALVTIDHFDGDVESHLLQALEDPYFEVRARACAAAAHFGRFLTGKEDWWKALTKCLHDPCFEVMIEAAKALGEIGSDGETVKVLLQLKESHYWQVRDAALKGLKRMLDRGVAGPSPELLKEISCFILTSTDFRPCFSIKETYRTLRKLCAENPPAPKELPNDGGPVSTTERKQQP